MQFIFSIAVMLIFGLVCGWFQRWMALRLEEKRWLLWLQPVLFAVIAACFLAWTLSLKGLERSTARWAAAPFAYFLICTLVGWAMGAAGRKKPPEE